MNAVLAICAGACVGALARWQLSLWLTTGASWLPLGTLVANLAGGWLVGLAIAGFDAHPELDPAWRLALVTGALGALTTFSTFSAETVLLLQAERVGRAAALAAMHLAGSLALTWLGLRCGRSWF
ncbi:fluoride efflux transporter CrcB [Ramlibacter rhizophilus]|uniref:Fluoride-specific ion channel FluC n=1 Tax=Ramlibacter rhizophilus TaxID=1781167 RepID=A0A4Z0BEL8_9BURK|nr:fluoride efflux transporter CrcB [Ramlibacter rhizophilus]TFY96767.1 fluoride efflux transporter CrcB [Ramlibacter rhizophilus]